MKILEIAEVCHQVNKAYCESQGDFSQKEWRNAPYWQKESAINGVKLQRQNLAAGSAMSHESWMKEKIYAGWVYGEIKDPVKKTHPCIVPFNELPKSQQAKDYIFRAVVLALS